MSNDREKIVQRVKKLLELADNNGATEAEATAAALAAQRLIAQHDVEQWEIHSIDAEPITEVYAANAPRRWRWQLANVIAPAFRCKFVQKSKWTNKSFLTQRYEKLITFFGYQTDAKAAAITFNTLYKIGNRLANRYSRYEESGTYNAYVMGFVDGIQQELEKQSEALMIVVPPKVREAYESEYTDIKTAKADLAFNPHAHGAYQDGIRNGRDAVRSHRFDATETTTQTAPAYAALGA